MPEARNCGASGIFFRPVITVVRHMNRACRLLVLFLIVSLACPFRCPAYSVLTHEAVIDAAWDASIRPLLLQRFPGATAEQLREAHAYAYGGAIIQDMGYYPHGSKFFSDLTHYVRSGDFVQALLRDSQSLDEYAFAIGALSHYVSDSEGHSLATNIAEPLLYPELRKKFGPVMSYEQDPLAHIKTEFGFDVLEVAKERYAPDSYRDFIGFSVAQRVLDQAFQDTYGLTLRSVFGNEQRTLGSYRRDVSSLIPKATKVAWSLKKEEIQKDLPGITRREFLFNISRSSYEKNWGKDYQGPTWYEHFLAFLYRLLPKIGPLQILTLRTPTPEAERLFQASFNATLDRYRELLRQLERGGVNLPNDNIDLGVVTPRGQYWLTDKTTAQLLDRLARTAFAGASPQLRAELLAFYAEPAGADNGKLSDKDRRKLVKNLEQLKSATAAAAEASKNVSDTTALP
jgi:Zinc dependent phospholipase C